ncbi:hypothetical protein TcWFU_001826 [Taenia crassiceps]|uniref:Uncharacterized protein n=1 Tax=Taenia crassiceps TaxID=6207 RepID=A0ABR4QPI5_9CEST
MAQHLHGRGQNRMRQPKSLESLYKTTQNFCDSIKKSLDAVDQQCSNLHINKEDKYVIEVLERINAFDGDLKLDALSDTQCQLLIEDLELDINENVLLEIVRRLRDLELLRKSSTDVFLKLNKHLSSMLDNGVCIFCVSLIELTQENVDEVIEYNDFISKQRSKLAQAVDQIRQHQERWNNLTMDTQSTLNNSKELGACLKDIQEEWNKIRANTIEWINQDREYPTLLANRIKQLRKTMEALLLEIETISKTKQQKMEERRHRELRMEALQKRRRELCSKLRLVQRAKRFNATRLVAFDSGSAQTEGDKEECNFAKTSIPGDGRNAIGDSKPQEEFCRRRDAKLDKEQSDIKSSLKCVNKRITELKRAADEDGRESDTNKRRISKIKTEIAQIKKISTDCREILLQRGKVQTFLQLQRGVIAEASRGKTPFAEVCKFVALRVRHEWPRLYLHLPMWPTRSLNQRQDDITTLLGFERMNVVLPRNRTSAEDAVAALEKWRLLSRHYVDVDGLATGLKLAGWSELAIEVCSRFGQEAGVAADSEKDTLEGEEAEDASADAIMESEIEVEAILSADNEEACLTRDEMDTPPKSLNDTISKITEQQNWSREFSVSESMDRDSIVNAENQSSLHDEDKPCLIKSAGSTTKNGDVMEVPPPGNDVLAQKSCYNEEGLQKSSMLNSRSGSIANESEKEEQNSSTDPPGNSSDNPSEQEEFIDKFNYRGEKLKENDSLIESSVHSSRRSSWSSDESKEKNGFSRRNSGRDSQRNKVNNYQNIGANPCMRAESSTTPTKGGDLDGNKSQNSFDKDNKFTEHDDWNSCKRFNVESISSEKNKEISCWKGTLEDNRGEYMESSAQMSVTSKEAAKQKLTDAHLKEDKSKETESGRYHADDAKNETKQGKLDDEENAPLLKSDSNKQRNKQGSDLVSEFNFGAVSAKIEDEDSRPQDELLIDEESGAKFDGNYSKEHSLPEDDGKGKDIIEQFLENDGYYAKSELGIQELPPVSKVPLAGQRTSRNEGDTQSSKDNKKACKVLNEKTKADSKPNQEEITKGMEREGHGAEGSILSQKEEEDLENSGVEAETNKQVTGIGKESEILRKTSTIPKSKKKLRDEKEGSGGNRKKDEKKEKEKKKKKEKKK